MNFYYFPLLIDFIIDSGFEPIHSPKKICMLVAQVCNEARAGRVRKLPPAAPVPTLENIVFTVASPSTSSGGKKSVGSSEKAAKVDPIDGECESMKVESDEGMAKESNNVGSGEQIDGSGGNDAKATNEPESVGIDAPAND